MLQDALGGGAFTWNHIQRLYDADPAIHWRRCESEGLECPQEVFAELFTENADDPDFAVIVRAIDWARVRWELEEFSGIALRHVRVDRGNQYARQLAGKRDGANRCRSRLPPRKAELRDNLYYRRPPRRIRRAEVAAIG
jgi:hypothetical protein